MKRILIANRGEIAVRVIETARKMGLETVAVYSEADKACQHVRLADDAVCIGPAPVGQSYLNRDAIIAALQQSGADAVHPGYGFLSENADFAAAVTAAGAVFIGPSPEVIRQMGDKRAARHIAVEAAVPVVPGFDGADADETALFGEAKKIGFPLMIKATAGGGGRGLRRVDDEADFASALDSARREAGAAFGNSSVMLEKLIEDARHVEVQILADSHGKVLHLFERDCSAQRRHQKVVEEAPCATITDATRTVLFKAAIALAKRVGYVGAGTVEFLVDGKGNVYFLEMNTRLQVEHPVTELITGVDLVEQQICVARGEALALDQDALTVRGHAIEVRLYAEKPEADFLPQTGVLAAFEIPLSAGARLDSGFGKGDVITPFYDPMLAKLIVHAPTREIARSDLLGLLHRTRITGVGTNKNYLANILSSDAFKRAEHRTHSLNDWHFPGAMTDEEGLAALAAVMEAEALNAFPIQELSGWRTHYHPVQARRLLSGDRHFDFRVMAKAAADGWCITVWLEDGSHDFLVRAGRIKIGSSFTAYATARSGETYHADFGVAAFEATDVTLAPAEAVSGAGSGILTAPMDGQIVAVKGEAGQTVKAGELILIVEAMKMEHRVTADVDGVIETLSVQAGQQVKNKAVLAVITPEKS